MVAIDSPEFKEFVQDALDLIEFANGSTEVCLCSGSGLRAYFPRRYILLETAENQVLDFSMRQRDHGGKFRRQHLPET